MEPSHREAVAMFRRAKINFSVSPRRVRGGRALRLTPQPCPVNHNREDHHRKSRSDCAVADTEPPMRVMEPLCGGDSCDDDGGLGTERIDAVFNPPVPGSDRSATDDDHDSVASAGSDTFHDGVDEPLSCDSLVASAVGGLHGMTADSPRFRVPGPPLVAPPRLTCGPPPRPPPPRPPPPRRVLLTCRF